MLPLTPQVSEQNALAVRAQFDERIISFDRLAANALKKLRDWQWDCGAVAKLVDVLKDMLVVRTHGSPRRGLTG
jgi:hypothetical protein